MIRHTVAAMVMVSALVLFSAILSQAATYKGVVIDSVSSTKLDSVLVTLKGASTQAYTNSQGQFIINTSSILSKDNLSAVALPLWFEPSSGCLAWGGNLEVTITVYTMQGGVAARSAHQTGAGLYIIPRLADGMYVLDACVNGMVYREKMMQAGTVITLDMPSGNTAFNAAKVTAAGDTLVFSKPRARTLPGGYTPTMPGYTDRQRAVAAGDTNLAIKLYGWPNSYNTGYRNAPGYTGTLTTFSGTIQSNQTYQHMYFKGGSGTSSSMTNVTFIGCRFTGEANGNWEIFDVAGNNTAFDYCSFEPDAAMPQVPNNGSAQFGIWQRSACKVTIDHCDFWGFANGIQLVASSQTQPFVVRNSWFHDARNDGGQDHTDGILENWGGAAVQYMVFEHNTIISKGNTNGLALQGSNYAHVTATRNYFSGFGYTVSFGHGTANTYMVFTDNVFGTDLQCGLDVGPLYSWCTGTGNQWLRNKWHVVPGVVWQITPQLPAYCTAPASDGQYWWPNACYDNCVRATDYTGN